MEPDRLSARRLSDAVQLLVGAGSKVVVGTRPDLGVVTAIPATLRLGDRRQYRLRRSQRFCRCARTASQAVPMADVLAKEFLARPSACSPRSLITAGYALPLSIPWLTGAVAVERPARPARWPALSRAASSAIPPVAAVSLRRSAR